MLKSADSVFSAFLHFFISFYFEDNCGHPYFFAQILVTIGTSIAVTTTDAANCVVATA